MKQVAPTHKQFARAAIDAATKDVAARRYPLFAVASPQPEPDPYARYHAMYHSLFDAIDAGDVDRARFFAAAMAQFRRENEELF